LAMQDQPMPSRLVSEPITVCRIGESPKGTAWRCPSCNRGCMHRAHRASYLDFFISIAGVYPTVCCSCKSRGRRLYPQRLAIRLCAASLTVGFIVICDMHRAKPVYSETEQPASAVSLKPQANSKSLPSPGNTRYASQKTPDGDVSLNPHAPPLIK
jgi:hypothetical protein